MILGREDEASSSFESQRKNEWRIRRLTGSAESTNSGRLRFSF
jgi:hypothetical protein